MEETMYRMIFKRKSFHRFREAGTISREELNRIGEAFSHCRPLIPEIRRLSAFVSKTQKQSKEMHKYYHRRFRVHPPLSLRTRRARWCGNPFPLCTGRFFWKCSKNDI